MPNHNEIYNNTFAELRELFLMLSPGKELIIVLLKLISRKLRLYQNKARRKAQGARQVNTPENREKPTAASYERNLAAFIELRRIVRSKQIIK